MRITPFSYKRVPGRVRLSAQVTWEDSNRPLQELYYEIAEPFTADLTNTPNALLAACAPVAMLTQERRLALDVPVCPLLLDRVQTNLTWFRHWYGKAYPPPVLELPVAKESLRASRPRRTGVFLSGGLDSLFTLWHNRRTVPRDAAGAIDDCVIVHGVDLYYHPEMDMQLPFFREVVASMQAVAAEVGAIVVPLYTNVRHLAVGLDPWLRWTLGGAMASVGHILSERLACVSLAASWDVPTLVPAGTHPIIDANYSSADLRVLHDGIRFTRLEKISALAEWSVGMEHLRVCASTYDSEAMNCGRCEKCMRTMLALAATGHSHALNAFRVTELTPQMVRQLKIRRLDKLGFHVELVDALRAAKRHDLAVALKEVIAEAHRSAAWDASAGWKGHLRRFDNRYLKGSMQAAVQLARGNHAN